MLEVVVVQAPFWLMFYRCFKTKICYVVDNIIEAKQSNRTKQIKKFVGSLDAPSFKIFLKFVTGSSVLITDQISISLVATEGLARRPITHTCGPTLEIPWTGKYLIKMLTKQNV